MTPKAARLAATVALALALCGASWRPVSKQYDREAENAKPEAQLSASELFKVYASSAAEAHSKYRWKVLEVSGTVDRVLLDAAGLPAVHLKTDNPAGGVECFFIQKDEEAAAALKKGEKVAVRGKCSDFVISVVLTDCVLVR